MSSDLFFDVTTAHLIVVLKLLGWEESFGYHFGAGLCRPHHGDVHA